MENRIQSIVTQSLSQISQVQSLSDLNRLQIEVTGRQGILTQEMKKLGTLPIDERKRIGALANAARDQIEECLKTKKIELERQALDEKLRSEKVDVTLPVQTQTEYFGKLHPLTQTMLKIQNYFEMRGFVILDGPEADTDFHNFEALNIPPYHPARQEQDTFYLKDYPSWLLRTQTTAVQARVLESKNIPIRAATLGSVFRNDAVDATHYPFFHQVDVFVVEKGITLAHLKHCLLDLLGYLFNIDLVTMDQSHESIPVRMRPSFFPFTEPSLEIDVCCLRKNNELTLDLKGHWMEIAGSGMIHKNVFKKCGLSTFPDGSPLQGYAFAFGIERVAMLRYGLTDIRHLYEGDLRWLNHYGAAA